MIAGCRRRGQLADATLRSGFIARRRADDVVTVDGGQLGLRRIWTISHDRLDHSRDCHRGRCRCGESLGRNRTKVILNSFCSGTVAGSNSKDIPQFVHLGLDVRVVKRAS